MLGALRKLFREERLPAWFRWICAAEGIAFWIRLTEHGLARHLQSRERARELLARAAGVAFRRRYELLRTSIPELPALEDADGAFRDAYGASGPSAFLVRPDGYLGYRGRSTGVVSALARTFA